MWDRNNNITIGFGTAALGNTCSQSITWALESGFRRFDTAEEQDYWYNQACVGQALESFFMRDQKCRHQDEQEEETSTCDGTSKEWPPEIFVDTKIPPYVLLFEQYMMDLQVLCLVLVSYSIYSSSSITCTHFTFL